MSLLDEFWNLRFYYSVKENDSSRKKCRFMFDYQNYFFITKNEQKTPRLKSEVRRKSIVLLLYDFFFKDDFGGREGTGILCHFEAGRSVF